MSEWITWNTRKPSLTKGEYFTQGTSLPTDHSINGFVRSLALNMSSQSLTSSKRRRKKREKRKEKREKKENR